MNTFPAWLNRLRPALVVGGGVVVVYAVTWFSYGAAPSTTNVGYAPEQPVAFSHALHAGELGLDCRYCHNTVERAARAAIPPTQTCMNCHERIKTESEALAPVLRSFAEGTPIPWRRVHDLPDYVYFDHSAHVTRGVGCVTCHGRIDTMKRVRQEQPLSMAWCVECHRDPAPHLRPPEFVTAMDWEPPDDPRAFGEALAEQRDLHPSTDCSTCHR